jgi:hypothetical protein
MAISPSIVEAHVGRLWATPNEGPGASRGGKPQSSTPVGIIRLARNGDRVDNSRNARGFMGNRLGRLAKFARGDRTGQIYHAIPRLHCD